MTAEPNFWTDLDDELLRCLGERDGPVTPAELGARLGMSEAAVGTIIAMLAESGKVRICSVERVTRPCILTPFATAAPTD